MFGSVGVSNMLINCRSGNTPGAPWYANQWDYGRSFYAWDMTAFQWYDVWQSHVLTDVTFRNCSLPATSGRKMRGWQMLTHSDQYVPDMMQATRGVRYEGMGADPYSANPYLIGVTVNNSAPSVSLRLQNWYDADGSASGRGKPTIMGSYRARQWWMLDGQCSARPDWLVYLCDATPAGRYVASATLKTGGIENTVGWPNCSNGDGAPCSDIGQVRHIGWTPPDQGLTFTNNARITGAGGGFGWYTRFYAGAPRSLDITAIQMRVNDIVIMALPYPVGTGFQVVAKTNDDCSQWCTLPSCRCVWNYTRVASYDEVRYGAGDTYYVSPLGHLYVRLTLQRGNWWEYPGIGDTLTNSSGIFSVWGLPQLRGFVRAGIEIPYRSSHIIRIVADCAPGSDPNYCPLPANLADPPSPCRLGQSGYDTCIDSPSPSPSVSATSSMTSSWSSTGTVTPSLSRTGTASRSLSASATASRSAAATGSPTGSVSAASTASRSGTPSRSASPTASPRGTPSRSGSLTGSLSRSATASRASASGTLSRSVSRTASLTKKWKGT